MAEHPEYVLLLSCPDRPGIVAAVSALLFEHGGNIEESQQFDDVRTDRFFLRIRWAATADDAGVEGWRALFAPVAERFEMRWTLRADHSPYRGLVMVSRFGHCLNDLLFRWQSGQLNLTIPAVVSNHRDLEPLVASYGIPFHHIPVTVDTKTEAEERLRALVAEHDVDLVVLARYMQVLSDGLARDLAGRVINIHHSFLPSFKGAKPYHQAFERGVKLVGATAHYVTPDLDEGPIIEQDVVRADHRMSPDELVRAGEEVESRVLARAVRWHCESRILRNGTGTVVFS
ncbi:formyltetrahydrofolate deformylase [Phycicoccus endophyticus]|uniref:Formyltetrahydrofolate deformylase n=1 Tax=Phycicoccus endophyticus TaxID=1690220 RepID=A0A7G9QYW7_9MICO|nr:formyltetrahydrofolate deformylase [Phycicoccus endophyticus]QNN48542.1 formyltetrahydrofolate deformylase [Phycicoccus endophyticus]GGL31103.1 formyltetrahydrofolate deformylase [Phycicoccus endophyticus]